MIGSGVQYEEGVESTTLLQTQSLVDMIQAWPALGHVNSLQERLISSIAANMTEAFQVRPLLSGGSEMVDLFPCLIDFWCCKYDLPAARLGLVLG